MKTSEAPLISVIIPAYNAEKYVAKCLKSIQNNTYKNLEIIVINDGSKDNTQSVVESFMEDKRIVLINVENGGVSKARNLGLDKATGEYVAFIDSDDYVREDYFEKLVRPCIENGVDSSCCVHILVDSQGNRIPDNRNHFSEDFIVTPREIAENYFEYFDMGFLNGIYRIYRMDIVGETRFSTELKWGEDGSFNLQLLKKSKKICVLHDELYFYFIHPEQATSKKMNGYAYMIVKHISDIDNYLSSYDAYFHNNNVQRMGELCVEYLTESSAHSKSLKEYKKEFAMFFEQTWSKFFKYAKKKSFKWRLMQLFIRFRFFQGIYFSTKLYRFYLKIKHS